MQSQAVLTYNFPFILRLHRGILTAEVIEMAERKKCGCGSKKADKAAETLKRQGKHEVPSDVQGSYTGTPMDNGKPIQDADDL